MESGCFDYKNTHHPSRGQGLGENSSLIFMAVVIFYVKVVSGSAHAHFILSALHGWLRALVVSILSILIISIMTRWLLAGVGHVNTLTFRWKGKDLYQRQKCVLRDHESILGRKSSHQVASLSYNGSRHPSPWMPIFMQWMEWADEWNHLSLISNRVSGVKMLP